MKKLIRASIVWFFVALSAIVSSPLIVSGQAPANLSGGVPVVFDGQTLFVIKNSFGSISPRGRQQRAEQRIAEYAGNYAMPADSLRTTPMDGEGIPVDLIVGGDQVIFFITEKDARTEGKKRSELSGEIVEKLRSMVREYRRARSIEQIAWGILASALATVALAITLRGIDRLFSLAYQRILLWEQTYIQAVRLGRIEIIGANQLDDIVTFLTKSVQAILVGGLSVLYLAFVLKRFPWTEGLAATAWTILLEKLQLGWRIFLGFLPNLITILLIIAFAYFLLRIAKVFFWRLRDGAIALPGFYAEWSEPTYRLVTILLIAMTAVAIVPMLPGFQSPAFQGIGVFFGLLISLGSSSVISNIISGSVLIYTRAFRLGDYISIEGTSGQVIEKNLLVTRLLTLSNEVVSIPNSQMINGSIKNLNFSSQELNKPLIIKTTVYLGYEVPWRQAYDTLIRAALQTDGVAGSPAPFVFQEELNNVFVTYLLGVYLDLGFVQGKTAKEFEAIRSRLHESVRDCCADAGIQIFTPSYEADPTNYGPVIEGRSG